MIIQPRVRGFICTTAHPVGCAAEVERQIEYIRKHRRVARGPSKVLVLGSSMGYGLSTRIAAAFGGDAATLGVMFEREATEKRTATAGWYNTAAFHRAARGAGLWAETINGDAFSAEIKAEALDLVRSELGEVDLVIYSLAAPRRALADGSVAKSVLKPIGEAYRNKTIDVQTGEVSDVEIAAVEDEAEIAETVRVMGGEDWQSWIEALEAEGLLAADAVTVAYSYIGPELTFPIYRQGTIGAAKDHLEATARRLDESLRGRGGRAFVSVNKAVVTQSSSAIPVVPLYISILFDVMKAKGLHEGCIEQMGRMMTDRLYAPGPSPVDEAGRIRLDDLEMRADVQAEVERRWEAVDSGNVDSLADLAEYRHDFLRLFGFDLDGIDYEADVDPFVELS